MTPSWYFRIPALPLAIIDMVVLVLEKLKIVQSMFDAPTPELAPNAVG